MFDTDRSGTIELPEFVGLWNFLHEWRNLFNQFDEDKSGQIDYGEFHRALAKFGFKISEEYERKIFEAHDVRGRGTLSFDLFVQACISLQRIASVFKRYDTVDERGMPKGWAYFSFEQFCQGMCAASVLEGS